MFIRKCQSTHRITLICSIHKSFELGHVISSSCLFRLDLNLLNALQSKIVAKLQRDELLKLLKTVLNFQSTSFLSLSMP